ncbi:MAG TPA: TonB-dependent receptor, partial [Planctomycetota bacterium]|nr:TonB-dependent receptor [Planctomycetota bacterium]
PSEEERTTGGPGRLTVIPGEEIRKHAGANPDWGSILAKVVPGMAPSTESLSNGGQLVRGGVITILIDGVPQSTPLRNSQRDLRIIDPSAVERVEVRHLPTGLSYGASGTVINFITKNPPAKEGPSRFETEVGAGVSLGHSARSFRSRLSQTAAGRSGSLGYAFAASREGFGGFFDGQGDRIPPNPHLQGGIAESDSHNVMGKLAWEPAPGQTLKLTVDRYVIRQDTHYVTVSGVAGVTKTGTTKLDRSQLLPGTRNLLVDVDYAYEERQGLSVHAGTFFQDYQTRFPFNPLFAGQSFIESVKWGASGVVDLPLGISEGARISLGLDGLRDRTAQPLTDGRTYAPRMAMDRIELFAQAKIPIGHGWTVKGGVRQEWIELDVVTYQKLFGGATVLGGTLDFAPISFNLGIEHAFSPQVRLFAGFAESFNLADIGLDLQITPAPSVEATGFMGQKVDNYELGIRLEGKTVRGSVTLFYNESDEGITFGAPPILPAVRRSEYVYGGEVAVVVAPEGAGWSFDASLGSMEGKYDPDDNGSHDEWLPGYRVPPIKIVAGFEFDATPDWRNRVQLFHSGNRDRFSGSAAFGRGKVESFNLVTVTSTLRLGPGTLRVSVENAFDAMYFPVLSSTGNLGLIYSAGQGAVAQVSYSIEW